MKFLSIFLTLFFLLTGNNYQQQSEQLRTWAGEIDGVSTWITVIARNRQFTQQEWNSLDWNEWGNTESDAYLFAFNDPNDVRLILTFEKIENCSRSVAKIFLNEYGNKSIDLNISKSDVQIFSNSGYPYLTMQTEEGDWIVDGYPNYDLEIFVDGIGISHILSNELITDGIIDRIIEVESNGYDTASRQTSKLVNDPHPTWGYTRFSVTQRFQPEVVIKDKKDSLMFDFPYLNIAKRGRDYFTEDVAPLYYDLRNMEFLFGSFPGFQDGGIWAINSLSYPPEVDFEAPFVFYNFDQNDRYAELAIRSSYFPVSSPFSFYPDIQIPKNNIRYSWKVENNTEWKYAIQTTGSREMKDVISVNGNELFSMSSENLAGWVINNNWPVINFIESIDGYPGSEGIYFYGGEVYEIWPWIAGRVNDAPSYLDNPYLPKTSQLTNMSYRSIPMDFRGEYSWGLDVKPELYISPIDNKVHLLNAKSGTWNLSENQILKYENIDKDGYIDTWILEDVIEWQEEENERLPEKTSVREVLYHVNDYLIYSSNDHVVILNDAIPDDVLRINPPTDQESWENFKEKIDPFTQKAKDPFNLKSWLDDFLSDRIELIGAKVSDFQHIPGGFSFVLNLSPNFKINSNINNPFLQLSPGGYFIQNIHEEWAIRDLVLPQLDFIDNKLIFERVSNRANQLVKVSAGVENTGDVSSGLVNAELWASLAEQSPVLVAAQEFTLSGNETKQITSSWQPVSSGLYSVELRLSGDIIKRETSVAAELNVLSRSENQLVNAARLSQPSSSFLLFMLLLGISASAVMLVSLIKKNYIDK